MWRSLSSVCLFMSTYSGEFVRGHVLCFNLCENIHEQDLRQKNIDHNFKGQCRYLFDGNPFLTIHIYVYTPSWHVFDKLDNFYPSFTHILTVQSRQDNAGPYMALTRKNHTCYPHTPDINVERVLSNINSKLNHRSMFNGNIESRGTVVAMKQLPYQQEQTKSKVFDYSPSYICHDSSCTQILKFEILHSNEKIASRTAQQC